MENIIIDQQPEDTPVKPRNAFVAFLLSVLATGLGQVYNGQVKKAIILFALPYLFLLAFGITGAITHFYGLVALIVIEVCLVIFTFTDAIRNALRQKEYIPKSYNTWYIHLIIAVGIIAFRQVVNIRDFLGIMTFSIPTPSNEPTILPGDYVVADMRAYKNKNPGYGDLAVYKKPDGIFYIHRVAGLPGDTIELNEDIITINGKPGKETFIKEKLSEEYPEYGVKTKEYEEEFPNGYRHTIYKFSPPPDSSKANIKNMIVPPGSYFLLGDHRDNALDSRYIGFIKRKDIYGQVAYSYWSKTKGRINIDFRGR